MFSGVTVPFSAIGVGPNYTIYAGDIQPFAGLTGELRFTEQAASFGPGLILDDIQFSNISIPEPNVTSLAVLAALLLGWRFLSQTTTMRNWKLTTACFL